MAMHTNGDSCAEPKLNSTKASFHDIYSEPTPQGYYKTLGELGYGEYHDKFTHLLTTNTPNLRVGVKKVIDIGCLYGSTAIAYAHGALWTQSIEPPAVSDLEITGVDISENALQFGLKTGVFSKVINQDLNADLSKDFFKALDEADTLLCMMSLSYMKDGVFASMMQRFAANGGKFAIYSTIPCLMTAATRPRFSA